MVANYSAPIGPVLLGLYLESKSKSAIAEARPGVVVLGDASSTELTVKEYALKPWALRLSVAMSRK